MATHAGDVRARAIRTALVFPAGEPAAEVSRAEIALALAGLLFDDVQRRVPMARAYVEDSVQAGHALTFDHGALRTVATDCGELPSGASAFARILEPLGYARVGVYDLSGISMTGYAFCHADLPEAIPQYFVSELHPERFSAKFQDAVASVVGQSHDPLTDHARQILERLSTEGALPFDEARALLPELVRCFDRNHEEPTVEAYETLLAESSEMAWIATEGNAFNHATDRVADVFAVADHQRALGRPIKDSVEVSRNGNVMQTAFRAATTQRLFRTAEGHRVVRDVPGSFHEFITRKTLADGALDLTFDAGNATSIFKMTAGQEAADRQESA
ncbi:2-oxoadipate dioxygenase/decarboxylase family protein [Planctomycetes bacterium Poly30]